MLSSAPTHHCEPIVPSRIATHRANGFFEYEHVPSLASANIACDVARNLGYQVLTEPDTKGGYLVLVRYRSGEI